MRDIKERSARHANDTDLEQLFSSDVSALKKLKMTERNQTNKKGGLGNLDSKKKEENFAG